MLACFTRNVLHLVTVDLWCCRQFFPHLSVTNCDSCFFLSWLVQLDTHVQSEPCWRMLPSWCVWFLGDTHVESEHCWRMLPSWRVWFSFTHSMLLALTRLNVSSMCTVHRQADTHTHTLSLSLSFTDTYVHTHTSISKGLQFWNVCNIHVSMCILRINVCVKRWANVNDNSL